MRFENFARDVDVTRRDVIVRIAQHVNNMRGSYGQVTRLVLRSGAAVADEIVHGFRYGGGQPAGVVVQFLLGNQTPAAISIENHHRHHVADIGLQAAVRLLVTAVPTGRASAPRRSARLVFSHDTDTSINARWRSTKLAPVPLPPSGLDRCGRPPSGNKHTSGRHPSMPVAVDQVTDGVIRLFAGCPGAIDLSQGLAGFETFFHIKSFSGFDRVAAVPQGSRKVGVVHFFTKSIYAVHVFLVG